MTYRIALLVDDTRVTKWVRDFADWAAEAPEIELVALIIHPTPQTTVKGFRKFFALAKGQGLYTAVSRSAFAFMVAIERKVLLRDPQYREHLCLHSIADRASTHIPTKPDVSKSGYIYRFREQDLNAIRELNLDALIRCGNGILKGGILSAARHGVISMHHADNRVNRGGPAAFWEVLQGQPQTGFIIQRLNEELDGGDVLFRGSISTEMFYSRNQASLYDRANMYLERTIQRLARGELKCEPPHIYYHRMYRTPLLNDAFLYAVRTMGRVFRRTIRRAIGREWHWGVAYTFQHWRNAVLWRGRLLPRQKNTFIADPFAIAVGGKHYVFVEEYPYKTRKGVISVFRIEPSGAERIGVVLEEPYHLSFPYVFRHGDEIYMVPESAADRSVKLYRCVRFPDQWILAKVLLSDVAAVDTLIFEHGERWWMLSTIKGAGNAPNDSELHAFWSDQPLGPWTPHPLNPVVMDASRGRNGGLLRNGGGGLYRVAQRHGFTRYGVGVSIYQIEHLSPSVYVESLVQSVEPKFFRGLAGAHHIHEDAGLTVYDFCRSERPQ